MQITFDELDMRLPGNNWVPTVMTCDVTVELADNDDVTSWYVTDVIVEGEPNNEHIRRYEAAPGTYLAQHTTYDPTFCRMIELSILRNQDQFNYLIEELSHRDPVEREYCPDLLN